VHGLAQRRRLLEFADKIFARASIRSRSHEERASCACSCGILWPVTREAPIGPCRATPTTLRRVTHQGRVDNNFDPAAAERGRPSRAGVAAALGCGPE